jgi:hypothetical protein
MYKPTPKQTERGLYVLIVVLLIIYGIWNSEIAIPLVKAFSEAMQIIISTTPTIIMST